MSAWCLVLIDSDTRMSNLPTISINQSGASWDILFTSICFMVYIVAMRNTCMEVFLACSLIC